MYAIKTISYQLKQSNQIASFLYPSRKQLKPVIFRNVMRLEAKKVVVAHLYFSSSEHYVLFS